MRKKIINEVFGSNLQKLRGDKTQAEVAGYIGVDQTTWSRYEKGMVPSSDILLRISSLFQTDAKELLGNIVEDDILHQSILNTVFVPVLAHCPAGFPDDVHEEIIEYLSLPDIPPRSKG